MGRRMLNPDEQTASARRAEPALDDAADFLRGLGEWENGLGPWLCAFLTVRQTRRASAGVVGPALSPDH